MNKKNIDLAVLLFGGTIGSVTSSTEIGLDDSGDFLSATLNRFKSESGINVDVSSPFTIFSEDMRPDDWVRIAKAVKAQIDGGCESVVVTQGTDTMAYTSAALSMLFADSNARIVITGSFYTPDHPLSDADLNLYSSLVAATSPSLKPGVYVAFGDSTGTVPIVPAIDLKPMSFDSKQFTSRYDFYLGRVDPDSGFRPYQFSSYEPYGNPFKLNYPEVWLESIDIEAKVSQTVAYPGMEVDRLVSSLVPGSVLIYNLYHSGTVNSVDEPGSLFQAIKKHADINFVLAPVPDGFTNPPYTSTQVMLGSGARIYKSLMPHSLYVWFVLGQMAGCSLNDLFEVLKKSELVWP